MVVLLVLAALFAVMTALKNRFFEPGLPSGGQLLQQNPEGILFLCGETLEPFLFLQLRAVGEAPAQVQQTGQAVVGAGAAMGMASPLPRLHSLT